MFRHMPAILATLILSVILFSAALPLVFKQSLYSLSLSIRDLIILVLPFIIFSLLFKAMLTLANNATKIIGMVLVLVCCANFLATFLSHYIGIWVYHFDLSVILPTAASGLKPLWQLRLPTLLNNDKAMFSGIILGIIAAKWQPNLAQRIAIKIERFVSVVLQSITYVIPIFVAGFVVKLQYDGAIGVIIKNYTVIFALIAAAQFSYLALVYFLLSKGKFAVFIASIKNMLPAAISGFSTMSSATSMPLTIIGVERNVKNQVVARAVVPLTVNIHLVGDCVAIPILAYAVLKSFGMAEPSLVNYLIFTGYFVLAKFSVAAIPGGGILVMLPILASNLGFHAEMLTFITALYILFDPVITCANVLGNGAFAKMIDRCLSYLDYRKDRLQG